MNKQIKQFAAATAVLFFASVARADFLDLQLVSDTRRTIEGLGNKFIIGCAILAAGIIVAAFVSRKR